MAPSLAEMPIPDGGICLRAKLPRTVTLCASKVPGCRYAHHSALEMSLSSPGLQRLSSLREALRGHH